MSSYLQFLSWLTSLGPKLPAAIAAIQKIMDAVNELVGMFTTRSLKKKAKAPKKRTAKELKAEGAVLAMLAAHSPAKTRAIGDGKLLEVLRNVWQFIQANPALWALILKMLGL